ncbi:NAD(P)H-binding protein [Chryseomicrobium palamuruense]|uniref:NAD(P)H-binding protein n=1 Tax=Chryseomicrobium palamuruense TaxID=682973 RepID=A0ABV8UV32_9BACL
MKALVIGATGATGRDLVDLLLEDGTFEEVHIFVRRELPLRHKKLQTHIIDFDRPQHWYRLVTGDVLFSCLGTTIKAAGTKEAQWKVDYDYQYQFTEAARTNGVPTYVLVSSTGASSTSRVFYSRMKGELEVAVKKLEFPSLTILQPPILDRKDSDRIGEKVGLKVITVLNKVGLLKSQRPLPTRELAQVMIRQAKEKPPGTHVLSGKNVRI